MKNKYEFNRTAFSNRTIFVAPSHINLSTYLGLGDIKGGGPLGLSPLPKGGPPGGGLLGNMPRPKFE